MKITQSTLVWCAFALMLLLVVDPAFAATTGLEWEGPLKKFVDSIKGPVAFSISLLGIVVCGAMLVFGGEINEFVRRFIMLVMVVSVIIFAASLLSNLFGGSSAVIAATTQTLSAIYA